MNAPSLETATLGGGCFWCTEAVFLDVEGVVSVESGYSNGHVERPSYEQVCTGTTGHAEVVRVRFDPQHIGFR
ncbi:MAG TPA: peptide-methionine (S)-S-oxide reductase, partial [Planctomycetota bacterium]|nr:peptide-methionine (S)-S-oxide reductase [Planctomycetota bacterium]